MFCLRPLCGVIFGPMAMTVGGAAFLGTLAALALAACAAAETARPREPERAEGRSGETAAAEPGTRRRRRGRAL
jgi:hypothetical protein